MTNLLDTIVPKSDQLNFDNFLGNEPKTIKVTKVSRVSAEQPIVINYDGDNGRPYKPCLSMRRVLVHCWGDKGNEYVGRSMTLYGDPKVKFGGLEVGGIRISHLSHIQREIIMNLTTSKANKKPFVVKPLVQNQEPPAPSFEDCLADIATVPTLEGLEYKFKAAHKLFKGDEQRTKLIAAKDARKTELTTTGEANV